VSWVPAAAVFLISGLAGVALGWRWRQGGLPRLRALHQNRGLPFFVRNLGFATLPLGISSLLLFSLFPIGLIDGLWAEFLGLGLWALAMLAFVVAIAVLVRPPKLLTPKGLDSPSGG